MNVPKSLVYAELLSNIKQVSILASLTSPCDVNTKVKLLDDGQKLTLIHCGQVQVFSLPHKVYPNFNFQVSSKIGSQELSWRLPLIDQSLNQARQDTFCSEVPWSAKALESRTELRCRSCNEVIVKEGKIYSWKDLPSENWAEMMDFWHCHKPDDVQSHHVLGDDCTGSQENPTSIHMKMTERGYGANNSISAQHGVGFVDISTFLITEEDCVNIKVQKFCFDANQNQLVGCLQCQNEVGTYHSDLNGIKFWKWKLRLISPSLSGRFGQGGSITTVPSPTLSSWGSKFSASTFVSAEILSKMSSQLVSKFLLMPIVKVECSTCLLLWVFGASIRFSSSDFANLDGGSGGEGLPAIKVFWKVVQESDTNLISDAVGIEDLFLPLDAILETEKVLKDNGKLIPRNSRKYLDWNVGLLERYEEKNLN